MAIAATLKRELGGSHRAIKTVMRWTGVSERTAKNWLAGSHSPAGEHLVVSMRYSEEVSVAVMKLPGRQNFQLVLEITELQSTLSRVLADLKELSKSNDTGLP